jgi:hypothetical protein
MIDEKNGAGYNVLSYDFKTGEKNAHLRGSKGKGKSVWLNHASMI